MYKEHIQSEKPKGLLPGVRVSFASPYTGWVSIYGFKRVIQTLWFKYRGSEVSFYRKQYNKAKDLTKLVKRVVDQSIVNALNLLRKKFFQQNINLKAQTIFSRVFMRSPLGGIRLQSESRGEFVSLSESSLYSEVIKGKALQSSSPVVGLTLCRNRTYTAVMRLGSQDIYKVEGIVPECLSQVSNLLRTATEGTVDRVLEMCDRVNTQARNLLEAEECQAMRDIGF
jgi:hypothetical protein